MGKGSGNTMAGSFTVESVPGESRDADSHASMAEGFWWSRLMNGSRKLQKYLKSIFF